MVELKVDISSDETRWALRYVSLVYKGEFTEWLHQTCQHAGMFEMYAC